MLNKKEQLIFVILTFTSLTQSRECTTGETCGKCPELLQGFRDGKYNRTYVLSQQCTIPNKKGFACCRESQNLVKTCANNEICTQCPQIIEDFRNGKLTVTEVKSKVCGGKNDRTFCCPRPIAKTTPKSPEKFSPSYLPSLKTEDCGYFEDASKIVGGNNTKPGVYPFMALIGKYVNNGQKTEYRCGGTIINRWYILTAAHCYLENDYNQIDISQEIVNIGEYDVQSSPDCLELPNGQQFCLPQNKIIDVEDFKRHEDFNLNRGSNKGVTNDIALVKLRFAITYNEMVKPVCLPLGATEEFDLLRMRENNYNNGIVGIRAHAIGWGFTNNTRQKSETRESIVATNVKQVVDLPILSKRKCNEFYENVSFDEKLCAGAEEGKDSCNGDSGGPLVINKFSPVSKNLLINDEDSSWIQVGVVSFGNRNCGSGSPGVYTRVSEYIPWIKRNLV
eukprot:TRINITY_DN4702_c0_g1_i5.p1 TRINITY_DN4702_c0_g1~~TRINITY_DN4702_c0_g1_i5.p1  ORF type:complete len:449 (-),score=40.10 TRINITY_DN4702_c0_g1_i5:66-1412(-)